MPSTVTMPELGESVTQGTVTRWLKQPGDHVRTGEPLLEVSTDKVDAEVPSPVTGTLLKLLAHEDDTVPAGGELALIGEDAAQPRRAVPEQPDPAVPQPVPTEDIPPGELREELQAATLPSQEPDGTSPSAVPVQAPARPEPAGAASPTGPVPGTVAPLSRLRRVIAQRMVESLATSAQLTTVQEVNLARISALRTQAREEFRQRHGAGLSYLPFFAKAAIEALRIFPAFNATLTSQGQVIYAARA